MAKEEDVTKRTAYIDHWKSWFKSEKVKRDMMATLIYCATVYLAIITLMLVFQRGLMYHPTKQWTADPAQHNMQVVTYPTADNLTLTAWYAPPKEGMPVFVLFHGNGGNISGWISVPDYFTKRGYGFLLAEYRGYGNNPGKPSEQGFYNDGRAAMAWLMREQKIPENKIIVYGMSIGSGTASQMAFEYKDIRALVLEAPFTSMVNEAGGVYPWIGPFKYLLFDKFDNIAKAPSFKMPVIVLQGDADEVISPTHGKALFDVLTTPVKKYILLRGGHHNDLRDFGLFEDIGAFIGGLN
jgi:pimeloyl-ACP methyl ester carboxylesterase